MTDPLRKAAEKALEALEKIYEGCGYVKEDRLHKHATDLATLVRKDCNPPIEALRQALAQPEQEPFIYVREDNEKPFGGYEHCSEADAGAFPVYTAPPKREWVGLTEEDKQEAFDETQEASGGFWDFADYLDAMLKEKNG